MKGIILAGDSGNRLHPITLGVPKQLLPVYDRPMVYFPIQTLLDAGVKDILVITAIPYIDAFKASLGDGHKFGANITYACQQKREGIAQAIAIGKIFIGTNSVCLITGDTIILGDKFTEQLNKAIKAAEKSSNATIFVKYDSDPLQYGKVLYGRDNKVNGIVGDTNSTNYLSIAGIHVFPNNVIRRIDNVQISERGLYEITSINQMYYKNQRLQIQRLHPACEWLDTNSFDNLMECSRKIQNRIKA